MNIREQGWECPKCQRIWAPKVAACGVCNDQRTRVGRHVGSLPRGSEFQPRFTRETPEWNFNGDDLSYT